MRLLKSLPLAFLLFMASPAGAATTLTDLTGKEITLPEKVDRFVISEGRYITALSILRPENPVEGLVGMMSPVSWTNPELEQQLFDKFPESKEIALFGGRDESSVSVEKIIDLQPQVAIFGIQDHGPGAKNSELIAQLHAAGTQVVFIDFRMDPLQNTEKSVEILGTVLSARKNADRYLEFYRNRKSAIAKRVKQLEGERPSVFLQAHVGRMDCCRGMADGMLGPFVEFAGGHNIADAVAPGPTSLHTAEFLLYENPDVWIATASGTPEEYRDGKSPVALGPGMDNKTALDSLKKGLDSPEFAALGAVQSGRAHAVWHNFYNSPLNIVALEAFARWIHPGIFTDLDPDKTMEEIWDEFVPFELRGVYTSSLSKAP